MATTQLLKSINTKDDGLVRNRLIGPATTTVKLHRWTTMARQLIRDKDYQQYVHHNSYRIDPIPPWKIQTPSIFYGQYDLRKETLPTSVLRAEFFERIHEQGHADYTIYCDGSLQDNGRAGSGMAVFKGDKHLQNHDMRIRVSDNSSTTQSELLAITAALKKIGTLKGSFNIISDSKSALQSLESTSPTCELLAARINTLLSKECEKGKRIRLFWAPSHSGIIGNEVADRLAKEACDKEVEDYRLPLSTRQLAGELRKMLQERYWEYLLTKKLDSYSLSTYIDVTNGIPPVYHTHGLVKRRDQTAYSRIRLGYKYLWEIGVPTTAQNKRCAICHVDGGHCLNHYAGECPYLAEYYNSEAPSNIERLKHILGDNIVARIKKRYPLFASAR